MFSAIFCHPPDMGVALQVFHTKKLTENEFLGTWAGVFVSQ
jgi:hypothetical protein